MHHYSVALLCSGLFLRAACFASEIGHVRATEDTFDKKDQVSVKGLRECPVPDDCAYCDAKCPERLLEPERGYQEELNSCKKGKELLEEKLNNLGDRSLLEECSFDICYSIRKKDGCGIPIDMTRSKQDQLNMLESLIAKKKKEEAQVKTRFNEKRASYISSSLYRYHTELQNNLEAITWQRDSALEIRSYNFKTKEYIDSYNFRVKKEEVKRLRLESEDYRRHWNFWRKQEHTLSLAVRTSPRALREARDQLRSSMMQYEADAELLAVLRNASRVTEGQVLLVDGLKEEMKTQIEAAKTINAQVKAEAVFIQQARAEIYNLLTDVLTDIQSGKRKVNCGQGELGTAVGSLLMSS